MRLAKPFYKLPFRFDAQRIAAEIAALPRSAWDDHPNRLSGNSCLRLISVDGGENDRVYGSMAATPHLEKMPYTHQLLASFGVVWSRSRLMRLAPGANVPDHSDINYHWFWRVRMHVPVITQPAVRFHCDGESVHMAAGEAWIFDNWRSHRVENPTVHERIHLVADTSGSSTFWEAAHAADAAAVPAVFRFDAARRTRLLVERNAPPRLMPPAELDLLALDLAAELATLDAAAPTLARLRRFAALLDALRRDWRQLYALHGDARGELRGFETMRDRVRQSARDNADGLITRSNGASAMQVLEMRILRALIPDASAAQLPPPPRSRPTHAVLDRPLIIVAAPRSGSTLLFETLAASERIASLGGESHEIIEGLAELRPGSPGVDSNRLDARHATPERIERLHAAFAAKLIDATGRPVAADAPLHFLEKTPKNALRIPFLERLFPQARYVFLWREPRENIASIVRAWQSGRWKTYNGLAGFDGPWSLALPPGWRALNGRPLIEIAAFQWQAINQVALQDLRALDPARWFAVEYRTLVAQPRPVIERLAAFDGLLQADGTLDAGLAHRLAAPLPPSRQTLAPADPDKWRELESEIDSVLPALLPTWQELRALPSLL